MDPLLHTELGAAFLRELFDTWRDINANHFRGKLRPPVLEFSEKQS